MPELPEVQAYGYYLSQNCLNKKIIDIKSLDPDLIENDFSDFKKAIINKKFTSVNRKGKYLIISLSGSNKKLIMHFGMTGTLNYQKSKDIKVKYSKVTFIFNDNSALHWINIRKFAKIKLIDSINQDKSLQKLGPDPLELKEKQFLDIIKKYKTKNIKAFLMDQSIISGIGNEYSDEILYQAGISPKHAIKDLSNKQLDLLFKKMQQVLKYAIEVREKAILKSNQAYFASDRTVFKSSYLQAHRLVDNKCPNNTNQMLKKEKIAGRTSYYCPISQK